MGDAVGAVGTAAGLVSLGLQLYNGISTYLEALESRKDDLKSAQAQLTNLRRSLAVVDDVLPQLALIRGSAVDTVSSSLEQCKAELSQLDIFVKKLVGISASSSTFKERMKLLKFPFNRHNLAMLEERLHKTNNVFQTVISTFHLLNSLDIGSKISEVKTDMDQIPELNSKVGQLLLEIHGLRTVVEDVTTEVNSTAAAIHASSTTVGHLQSGVEAFAPKVVSQLSTIRQGFDTVAKRNDVSEVKTIVKNNADVLKQITTAMDHLTGMTDSSLPNLAQMSSTLASMNRMLQGLSETERLLDVKDHWQPGHRRAAVSRLLAKPSQTKELYDLLPPNWTATGLRKRTRNSIPQVFYGDVRRRPRCSCLHQKDHTTNQWSLGYFWMRSERRTHGHAPTCEYFNDSVRQTSRLFDLVVAGHNSILSVGLRLTFAITTGAGAWGISPNITFRPVVDSKVSPVFMVCRLLQHVLCFTTEWSDAEASRVLQSALQTIMQIYKEKRSTPNDVDEFGKSILHLWVQTYSMAQSIQKTMQVGILDSFATELVRAGIPANIPDFNGRSPAMSLAANQFETYAIGTLRLLFEEAPELYFSSGNNFRYNGHAYFLKQHLLNDRTHAEIFDSGPLSTAIITNHYEQIDYILSHQTAIFETNALGQTPLHLAVKDLRMLKSVLRVSEANLVRLRDNSRCHVIDYAMLHSSARCRNKSRWSVCSGCDCSDALNMLLSIDGCLESWLDGMESQHFGQTNLVIFFIRASHCVRERLLGEIRSRRLQLKRIALEVLNEREIQSYELSKETVLDRYTVDVIACLKNYGYEVTEFLGFGLYHQIHPEMPSVAASLYGRIASSFSGHKPAHIVANLIYELGFRDVDIADSSGYTPLMRSLHRPFQDIHLTLWLLDHGADPTTNFSTLDATARWNLGRRPYSWSRNSLLTAAHLILCCDDVWNGPLGHYSQSQDKEAFAALIMRVSSLDVLDCCGCCCTESGCSPASLLFLGLWRCFGSKNRTDSPQAIVSCVVDYFTKYSVDLTGHNSVCLSAFRMLTFEALGMTHTCCQGGAECKLSDNEITEVWDSESRLTVLLKTLQVEFAKSYPELGLSFVDFLTSQWAPRLERAVLELKNQKMSEDELATTLVLGVRWDNEELADTTVSSSSESESEDESDGVHYWIEELKKIAKNDPSARKW
ncbi:hypothetical protein BKA67DRAFT_691580 [Truncatella angustata]|uniref:Fungal N-terminal domain-containing protein n=1 Tax=Truncatella angustata TaxID=152316 RepID=A0A9P8UM09_9PEZI|nr:uncharacterized protein BKA67DRAFT_691580 [Truncatella angustata]KAH6654578.1 hypothetical protein BKA67DRAFT_691580 [Truncatella angustata]